MNEVDAPTRLAEVRVECEMDSEAPVRVNKGLHPSLGDEVGAPLMLADVRVEWEMDSEAAQRWMGVALSEARAALRRLEVPVGCVIVRGGSALAVGSNRTNAARDSTRHAEMEALDALLQREEPSGPAHARQLFRECTLVVTCEPCIMCAAGLSLLGLTRVVYGCSNQRFGGCGSVLAVDAMGCGPCGGGQRAGRPSPPLATSPPAHRREASGAWHALWSWDAIQ